MQRGTKAWTWTWLCILAVTHTLASNEWLVGENDPSCQYAGVTLFCDYQGKPEDVHLTGPLNSTIEDVKIHNVQKLHISDTLCANVSLMNVADVVVVKDDSEATPCMDLMEFNVRKCKLNHLLCHASIVFLEDSELTSLSTSTHVTRITVLASHIQNLNVDQPLMSGARAAFIQSSMKKVEKLQMNINSSLLVQNSTMAYVQPGGLVLRGGEVTFRQSRVSTMTDDSVLLGDKTFLTLEDQPGILKFKVMLEEQLMAPCEPCKLCEPCKPCEPCETANTYFIAFIICLILLCLVLLMLAYLLIEKGMNLREKVNNTKNRINKRRTGGNTTHVDIEYRKDGDGGTAEITMELDLGKGSDSEEENKYKVTTNSQDDNVATVMAIIDGKLEESPLHKTYREGKEKILVNIRDLHKQAKRFIEQINTNKDETLKVIEGNYTIPENIKEENRKEIMFLPKNSIYSKTESYLLYEIKGLQKNLAKVINFKDGIDLRISKRKGELNQTKEIYNHNQIYIKQLIEINEDETNVTNEGPANMDATAGAILKNLKIMRLQIQNQSQLDDEHELCIIDTSTTFNEEPEDSLKIILDSRYDLIFKRFLPDGKKDVNINEILYHVIKGIETISKELESECDLHNLTEKQFRLQMLITEQERIINQLVLIDTIIGWLLPAKQQKPKQRQQEDTEITPLLPQMVEQHQDTHYFPAFTYDGTMPDMC